MLYQLWTIDGHGNYIMLTLSQNLQAFWGPVGHIERSMGVFNRVYNGSSFPIIWMAFLGISSSSQKRSHETLRLWVLFLRGDPVVFSADFVMLSSCAKGLSSGETDRRIIAWPLASAIVKRKFWQINPLN
jgi:hypothetical protein